MIVTKINKPILIKIMQDQASIPIYPRISKKILGAIAKKIRVTFHIIQSVNVYHHRRDRNNRII